MSRIVGYIPDAEGSTLVSVVLASPADRAASRSDNHRVRVGVASGERVDWVGEWDGSDLALSAGVPLVLASGLRRKIPAGGCVVVDVETNGSPTSLAGCAVVLRIGSVAVNPGLVPSDRESRDAIEALSEHLTAMRAGEFPVRVALHDDAAVRLPFTLDATSDALTIGNTALAATLYSVTVPPFTLRKGRALYVRIQFYYLNNTGSNQTLVITLSMGGVTLYSDTTANIATSGNKRPAFLEFVVALSSTTAVNAYGFIGVGAAGGAATGYGDIGSLSTEGSEMGNDGVSLASGRQHTLSVALTHSTGSSSLTLTRWLAVCEVIGGPA